MLVGEQGTRSSESTLNLVENQRRAVLPRERAQLAHEVGGENTHAALTLHGLGDNGGDRSRREQGLQRRQVALDDRHAAGERTKWRTIGRAVGCSKRREQSAMEAAAQRDDLGRADAMAGATPPARELERAFVRFRAGVAEEDARREGTRDERLGERATGIAAEQVRHVDETGTERLAHRLGESRVAVAERIYCDTAREVEVRAPVGVEQPNAFTAHDVERHAAVDGEQRIRGVRRSSEHRGHRHSSRR